MPAESSGVPTSIVFGALLAVALVGAACTWLTTRRHGPNQAIQLSEAQRWAYRRIHDLSMRGAGRYDPHLAERLTHARQRAARRAKRTAKRGASRIAGASASAAAGPCYSLSRPWCSLTDPAEPAANSTCVTARADHLHARAASSICGTRLDRLNPCWSENGTVSCLPAFYLLGEMKCGTTTLYVRRCERAR